MYLNYIGGCREKNVGGNGSIKVKLLKNKVKYFYFRRSL